MKSSVQTARGPIGQEDLGMVLMHEHLFILTDEYMRNYPARQRFDEVRHVATAVESMNELKDLGFDTIVDLTVLGMGRNVTRIKEIARATDINIVVATGIYFYEALPMPFHFQGPNTLYGGPEMLVDMFVEDIVDGIADTGVHAAVIKCATDEFGMTPEVERAVRAAARAQLLTGVPISTHTNARAQVGLDQVRIFQEEGVDLSKVVIGHSDGTTDLKYLIKLLATGVSLGMDQFGTEAPLTTLERVSIVDELCRQGFSTQLVLSHDASIFNDFAPGGGGEYVYPEWNFTYLSTKGLPALRAAGVTEQMLKNMLIENPARLFFRA